jgi:hypothetical protein
MLGHGGGRHRRRFPLPAERLRLLPVAWPGRAAEVSVRLDALNGRPNRVTAEETSTTPADPEGPAAAASCLRDLARPAADSRDIRPASEEAFRADLSRLRYEPRGFRFLAVSPYAATAGWTADPPPGVGNRRAGGVACRVT